MNQTNNLDPCKRCFLQGLCDRDECGRHLFELDTNKAPYPTITNMMDRPIQERKSKTSRYIQMRNKAVSNIWTRL